MTDLTDLTLTDTMGVLQSSKALQSLDLNGDRMRSGFACSDTLCSEDCYLTLQYTLAQRTGSGSLNVSLLQKFFNNPEEFACNLQSCFPEKAFPLQWLLPWTMVTWQWCTVDRFFRCDSECQCIPDFCVSSASTHSRDCHDYECIHWQTPLYFQYISVVICIYARTAEPRNDASPLYGSFSACLYIGANYLRLCQPCQQNTYSICRVTIQQCFCLQSDKELLA